jgi:CHAT domain-containing protein
MALPDERRAPWVPAAERGLTHRYAAENLSVAKWLEERLQDDVLSVLLVANPTEDLQGAAEEGRRVQSLFGQVPGCRLDVLWEAQATRPALLSAFGSGKYDIIHYAGHAFFDELAPERSGLLCAGHATLTGADLAGLGRLPTLVFFNACEAGRVRGHAAAPANGRAPAAKRPKLERMQEGVGVAEAFMRGGIANFLGTYWPVGDAPAKLFAESFYRAVTAGQPLGDAIQGARGVVRASNSKDWADYVFYGNPDFVLKEGVARAAGTG